MNSDEETKKLKRERIKINMTMKGNEGLNVVGKKNENIIKSRERVRKSRGFCECFVLSTTKKCQKNCSSKTNH